MVVLRADPWSPDYGMGFDVALEDAPPPMIDPFVETSEWGSPIAPPRQEPGPVWFVDGVRRVEVRLLAEEGGRRVPGLFGSFAVGGVRAEGRACFGPHRIARTVILGGGVMPGQVNVAVGSGILAFEPTTDPGMEPDRPLWRLQQLMREAEAGVAAAAADESDALVLVDGPLTFRDPTRAPVVGVVKRFSRQYLAPEQDALLGSLEPGERSPLFALGTEEQPVQRYAWYTRVARMAGPWHDHAGIVRCEVREGLGLDRAAGLAGRVCGLLPGFAGRPSDPRTPQNLTPVAGLESWLRHRMGDRALVRRAVVSWLALAAEGA